MSEAHATAADPALRQKAQALVRALVENSASVRACMLGTEDGREIATYARDNALPTDQRLTAMASSMAALGSMAGQEYQLGECTIIIIEAQNGYIIVQHIAHIQALRLVLGVVADKSNTALAEVLYHMRNATGRL